MLSLESYEAISAFGTLFAGIVTALAVVVSIQAASRKHDPFVSMSTIKNESDLQIIIHNEGDYSVVLNGIGGYYSGQYLPLIDGLEEIQPSHSKTFTVSGNDIESFVVSIIKSLNVQFDNHGFSIFCKKQPISSDRINLNEHYSFRFAVRISGQIYLDGVWSSAIKLISSKQAQNDYYHVMKKYKVHDWNQINLMLLMMSPFCIYLAVDGARYCPFILLLMAISLYYLNIRLYTEIVQSRKYQQFISLWIGMDVGFGIGGLGQYSFDSIIIAILFAILAVLVARVGLMKNTGNNPRLIFGD